MTHDQGAAATRSPVVFKYVEDSYPTDGEISFTIICDNELQSGDYIALHTIGSYDENSPIFKLTYNQLKVHPDGHVASAVIPVSSFATSLPDDGFYQLCYYSQSQMIDASTPIQIRRARAEDLLEAPAPESPEEDEFVVIKSDKALLQERINTLTRANEELEGESYALKNYVRKLEGELTEMATIKASQDSFIRQMDEENSELSQAVATINLDLHDRDKQIKSLTESLEKYRAMSREKVDEFNEISKCKSLVQEEHQKSLLQIQELEKQTQHLTATLKLTRANFDAQSQIIHDGQAVQEEMKSRIQELTRSNDDLSEKVRSMKAQIEKLEIASKFAQLKYEESQNQVDLLTQQNSKLQGDLVKVTDDCNKAKARHEKLKTRVSAYFERKGAKSASQGSAASAETIPKTVEESQATAASVDNPSVTLPCEVCGEEVTCVSDLQEMAQHMETRHNIRLCPFCSQTFDGSLSTTERELEKHVDEHLAADD